MIDSARPTAGTAVADQTAYPPPRESCVRGADRAAVDKRLRPSAGLGGSVTVAKVSRMAGPG